MKNQKILVARVSEETWDFFKRYSIDQRKSMSAMLSDFVEKKKKQIEKRYEKDVD